MNQRSLLIHRFPAALLPALLSAAAFQLTGCQAPEPDAKEAAQPVSPAGPLDAEPWEPPAPKPWTDFFHRRKALLGDRIRIEGPEGLLEHVAPSVDTRYHEHSVKMTDQGLLQVTKILTADSPAIGAQLDGWQILALHELTILERLEPCDVVVVAEGEAYWKDPASGKEEREDVLRFSATIEE